MAASRDDNRDIRVEDDDGDETRWASVADAKSPVAKKACASRRESLDFSVDNRQVGFNCCRDEKIDVMSFVRENIVP
ncbi:uncharacterized protein SPSK_03811 [Sporothrix schenckii 1099-18]|uniref:Uncharacterized protein n=1 Tax=Sporothrix schenckii 1099-18 TaxID=1397361 RepID=A0A0F2M399_SPOSC|nr:uncharacterized protein SPSK_03811 [Sporothrix schenckii 1099-18]KJR82616.1 hypothetical protein SPSK_03811 [Sporothrix schenckii 1099-18]